MKKVIIMGATSGLGKEIAKFYISKGCVVGIAGRRTELLKSLQSLCPDRVHIQPVDVTSADARVTCRSGAVAAFLLGA